MLGKIIESFIIFYVQHFVLKIHKNEWCFIAPYGIGDTYFSLALMSAFRKQNVGVNKIKFIITKKNHLDILEYFPNAVDKVLFLKAKWTKFVPQKNCLSKGIPIYIHPSLFFNNIMLDLIGYNGISLADTYKFILNLHINTPFQKPKVSELMIEKAFVNFDNYNLVKGQTLLLAPEANSIDQNIISFENWENLCNTFNLLGFKIAIISSNPAFKSIPNVIPVEFSLSESIPFVELCGYFISLRSGLCDLIATSACKKYILYPKIKQYSSNIIEWASLRSIGEIDNIEEFEFSENNITEIFNIIIKSITDE